MREQSVRTSAVIMGSSRLRAENRLTWRSMGEDVRPNHVTTMVVRRYGKGGQNEVSDPAQIPLQRLMQLSEKYFTGIRFLTSAVIMGSSRLRAANSLTWRSMSKVARPNHVTAMVVGLHGKGGQNEVSDSAEIPLQRLMQLSEKYFTGM
jgi:hypothetical protein